MKWSKKQQAKWDKKNMDRSTGHSVNNEELEQDQAWKRLQKKLEQPEVLAVFRRMKDR